MVRPLGQQSHSEARPEACPGLQARPDSQTRPGAETSRLPEASSHRQAFQVIQPSVLCMCVEIFHFFFFAFSDIFFLNW